MNRLFIRSILVMLVFSTGCISSCRSQSNDKQRPQRKDISGMAAAANDFLNTLTPDQKKSMQFSYDEGERYNWHYIPKDRKGLPLKELSDAQRQSAMAL